MMQNIKLGITLYSLTPEYIQGKLDLEGLLKRVKDLGFEGIEIVASQMVPEYPYPSEEWLTEFRNLLKKYELTPVCWSAYVDMGIRSDRDLTEDEIVQFTINDLVYAKKAGFPMVRTQHAISPAIFRRMIPICKKLGVKLTIEMHHPHHPEVPVWKEYLSIMKGEGKGVLGVVPDFSMFQHHPHQLYIDQAVAHGFRKGKLADVIDMHDRNESLEQVLALDLTPFEREVSEEIYHKFNAPAHMEQWKDLIECSFYIHGKFYYLPAEGPDPCIPYRELLTTIRDLGYKGYIAAEYEGHHFDMGLDTTEQLRRYVKQYRQIIDE